MTLTNDSPQSPDYRAPDRRPYLGDFPPWYAVIVVVLLVAILSLLGFLVARDDDSQIQTAVPSTSASSTPTLPSSTDPSSTEPSSTTSVETSSTTSAAVSSTTESTVSPTIAPTVSSTIASTTSDTATTTTVDPDTYKSAVWPWSNSTVRYNDPVAAAAGFAEDFLGFDDPVIRPFAQGDSRSGEVEVQPLADGPITVIFVRQLGPDNTWWVLGAATANIVLDEPDALDNINSPLRVAGKALAFEGAVDVELRADGSTSPLINSFVTGGGIEMMPFDSNFNWTNPGDGAGALVLLTRSMESGQVWEAAVVRVEFARVTP